MDSAQTRLKKIEKALGLARAAYSHEVAISSEQLRLPENQRQPLEQLHRLGDVICLLQNILYDAQQTTPVNPSPTPPNAPPAA